jgi:hypothetical protein
MQGEPWELVSIRADLDQNGQMPEHAHHVQQRSLAPSLKDVASNVTGIGHRLHAGVHEHGEVLDIAARDLALLW